MDDLQDASPLHLPTFETPDEASENRGRRNTAGDAIVGGVVVREVEDMAAAQALGAKLLKGVD